MLNKDAPIAVYDSGDGALAVLATLRRIFPQERWLLVQDRAHAPYGEKSAQQVFQLGYQTMERIAMHGVKACVVACHTSSSVILPELQYRFSFPIIGMLLPSAAGLACYYPQATIACLATPGSIHQNRLLPLARSLGFNGEWLAIACPDWASCVDRRVGVSASRRAVARVLAPYRERLVAQQAVLFYGCTHYPWLDAVVAEYLALSRVDPSWWVAQRLGATLRAYGVLKSVDMPRDNEHLLSYFT